ncbi:MAG: class I SAM-dependent DNA methyltransferase [Burkholderiaceae bacterium]
MSSVSLPAFDALYRGSADPWLTETRWYERRKRALVLACLPHERYEHAYEPGCGSGVLTHALAARCDDVLASDGSDRAVAIARRRLAGFDNVKVERHAVPEDWPSRAFDLVVLSELVYFLDSAAIDAIGGLVARSIAGCDAGPGAGTALACNWRAPIAGYGHSGDEAHRRLAAAIGLPSVFEYRDADFIVSAWSRDPKSVAMRESIR